MRIRPLAFALSCLAPAVPSSGRGQDRVERLLEELTNAAGRQASAAPKQLLLAVGAGRDYADASANSRNGIFP